MYMYESMAMLALSVLHIMIHVIALFLYTALHSTGEHMTQEHVIISVCTVCHRACTASIAMIEDYS